MWDEIQDMPGEIFDLEAMMASQGKEPSKAPASRKQFPCTIGARTFETEADYQDALHDFLNGM